MRSVSAVGEQYVDLQPPNDAPPYLQDGSVIALDQTAIPEPVGPMLDRLSALVGTIPKDKLGPLLDESFTAFNGAGYDIGSLLDSSSKVIGDLNGVGRPEPHARRRQCATARLASRDRRLAPAVGARPGRHHRSVGPSTTHRCGRCCETGPDFAQEVSRLLEQVKPTLPVLLANLTSIGQVFVTYNKSIEQLLVLFPPYLAGHPVGRTRQQPDR